MFTNTNEKLNYSQLRVLFYFNNLSLSCSRFLWIFYFKVRLNPVQMHLLSCNLGGLGKLETRIFWITNEKLLSITLLPKFSEINSKWQRTRLPDLLISNLTFIWGAASSHVNRLQVDTTILRSRGFIFVPFCFSYNLYVSEIAR